MKYGLRTPSLKKSVSARTTSRIKRTAKSINPLYGKKGMGLLHPQKAIYNKVYHKTSFGILDLFKLFKK